MHTPSLARYVACLERGDLDGVAGLMLASARKLAVASVTPRRNAAVSGCRIGFLFDVAKCNEVVCFVFMMASFRWGHDGL